MHSEVERGFVPHTPIYVRAAAGTMFGILNVTSLQSDGLNAHKRQPQNRSVEFEAVVSAWLT